jgi:GPI mannosyltransferase 3
MTGAGKVDESEPSQIWAGIHFVAIAALSLRLAAAWSSLRITHPDEVFQYLEQAHRLVFGYGIVPWEFRLAARNWLLPGTLAVLLDALRAMGLDSPTRYIPALKSLLALLSVCLVYSSYAIGRNMFCERTARLAAVIAALWYELLYVSTVATPEVLSAYAIVGALVFATARPSPQRAALAGLLLGSSVALRLPYAAPAIAVWIITVINWQWRSARCAAFACATVVAFAGLLDAWSWGTPFISYYNNMVFNLELNKSEVFGRSEPLVYLYRLAVGSIGLHLFAIVYGALQWRRCWPILVLVACVLIPHSLIPHKEFRFVFLAIPLLLLLLADAIANITRKQWSIFANVPVLPTAIAMVAVVSLIECAARGVFARDDRLVATLELSRRSNVAAVLDLTGRWWHSGGFYYLHRDVPLYFGEQVEGMPIGELRSLASHVLVPATQAKIPGFRIAARFRTVDVLEQEVPPTAYRRLEKDGRTPHQPGLNDESEHWQRPF